MKFVKKLVGDFIGLCRILGLYHAFRWIALVLWNIFGIVKVKNLQPVDQAMGQGPFRVRIKRYDLDFFIAGAGAFSGIREMYVRDTYLRNGLLTIKDYDVVLDLGANMGNFTNLALAHGKSVRVISVEPSRRLNNEFKQSISLNSGFIERTQLLRAFLGAPTEKQDDVIDDKHYAGVAWISEDELLSSAQLTKIDFLKCDIEGGEYGLLHPKSKLLKMAKCIAIEVHKHAGDVEEFIKMLAAQGFEIKYIQRDPDGTATVLGMRR
jgi:FkbM family methyltransferase